MHAFLASLLTLALMAPAGPGWLGIYLAMDTNKAVVQEVIPDTPAAKAGLEAGDVLLSVAGKKTPTRDSLIEAIAASEAGTRVAIELQRKAKTLTVMVKLGERPANPGAGAPVEEGVEEVADVTIGREAPAPAAAVRPGPAGAQWQEPGKAFLGVSVREGDKGLVVERVIDGGPCAGSGLEKDDVIVSFGDRRIRTLEDLDEALTKAKAGKRVALGVANENTTKMLTVVLGSRPGNRIVARDVVAAPRAVEIVREQPATEEVVEEPIVTEVEVVEAPRAVEVVREEPRRVRVRRPARAAQPARPARPAEPARPARPAEPARPARAARPARTARGRDVEPSPEVDLKKELRELRAELKELRKLLEQMRQKQRGGGGRE